MENINGKCQESCYGCDCYDSDREGCTMPTTDRWYACSLEEDVKLEDLMDVVNEEQE